MSKEAVKPDWNDAPDWADYLAMDSDGRWFWFEHRPTIEGNLWHPGGKCIEADIYIDGWGESLEKRP